MTLKVAATCLLLLVAQLAVVSGQTTETSPAYSTGYNASNLVMQNVSYTDGTSPLRGFLAYDQTFNATRPVVVIFPDYDGIGPYEMWRAKLFATLGYVAFVGDIYTQNIVQGPSLPIATRNMLTQIYTSNVPLWVSRMEAALAIAVEQPYADPDRIAAVGYCFGGGGIVNLARAYPNVTEGLLGVVGFHPSLSIAPIAPGNPIEMALFLGHDDPGAPPTTVDNFQASLEAANVTWQLTEFGETVHAFTIPSNVGSQATASTAYNPTADKMSWYAMRGFLEELFGDMSVNNPYTSSASEPALDLMTS